MLKASISRFVNIGAHFVSNEEPAHSGIVADVVTLASDSWELDLRIVELLKAA